MRKEVVDAKIEKLDSLIKMKEDELRGLEKEVEFLKGELMERVVRVERGMLSKKKRVKEEKEQKELEMKKLDLEIMIDGNKEEMKRMEKRREELISERAIVEEYIKRYEEGDKEEERQPYSEVRISQTLPNIFKPF